MRLPRYVLEVCLRAGAAPFSNREISDPNGSQVWFPDHHRGPSAGCGRRRPEPAASA